MNWEVKCQKISRGIRERVLEHTINHGGYLSQACSSAEIFSILYNKSMKLGPSEGLFSTHKFEGTPSVNNPHPQKGFLYNGAKNPDLDRFFLSPSHYALTLYAALIETKRLNNKSLKEFNKDGSVLDMIGSEHSPGHETNGGSFGQTISQAAGVAWARRRKKEKGLVWLFLSDGEFQEGQTWEAARFAVHNKLDNLVAIYDYNNILSIFLQHEKCYKTNKKLMTIGLSVIDLSTGQGTLAPVPEHAGGAGQVIARLCCQGVRGFPEVRSPRAWLPACSM